MHRAVNLWYMSQRLHVKVIVYIFYYNPEGYALKEDHLKILATFLKESYRNNEKKK